MLARGGGAGGAGPVVIAEAMKFDAGEVIVLLLIVLASILATAGVVALIGVPIGIAIGRRTLPTGALQELPRGSWLRLALGGLACPMLSWIALWILASWLWSEAHGTRVLLLASLPLPIAWGWWNGRRCRFWGAARPSPPPAPPGATQ